ncbi:MAG: Hpt domain-containing protein, partial [Flavobacteriaceae bacterium]
MTNGNGFDLGDMSMMDLFRMETENQCNQLSEDLISLEQNPGASDLLESLMRATHSVKGAARVVELHPVVQIAHAMEDIFVAVQENKITLDQDGIDLLLKGVDMLSTISKISDEETDSYFQEKSDAFDLLTSSFNALIKGKKASPEPPKERRPSAEAKASVETEPTPERIIEIPPSLPVDLSDMSMLDLFRMEADNYCMKLSEDLAALENDPTSAELLENMMRAAHSIKGAAKIVGLEEAVKLAHTMEDVFVTAQKENIFIERNEIDILHKGVDILTAIANIPETDAEKWFIEHSSEIDGLVKNIANIKKKEKAVKIPAPQKESRETKKTSKPAPVVGPSATREKEKKIASSKKDKEGFRALRISAQNMERMMGLAGESLIESRWLPVFNKDLLQLKYRQDELYSTIDKIRENLQEVNADEMTWSLFDDLQHKL